MPRSNITDTTVVKTAETAVKSRSEEQKQEEVIPATPSPSPVPVMQKPLRSILVKRNHDQNHQPANNHAKSAIKTVKPLTPEHDVVEIAKRNVRNDPRYQQEERQFRLAFDQAIDICMNEIQAYARQQTNQHNNNNNPQR